MNGSFVSLNYACEESIADYLIAHCDSLQTTASYYTGIGDIAELQAPAVIITAENGTETHPSSNCFDMSVIIYVKEMAADVSGSVINPTSTNSPLGSLTANIFNAICTGSLKYELGKSNQHNFICSFAMKQDTKHSVREDALISELGLRIVGALSGSI